MWGVGAKIEMDCHKNPIFKITSIEPNVFVAECLRSGTNFKKGEEYRFAKYLHTHFKVI